jgi:cation transport regulator ChaB
VEFAMPGKPTAPSTLSGHAADIWRSAFASAYSGTCKDRSDRDACAASVAWSAVKNVYKKGEGGQWVEKAEGDLMTTGADATAIIAEVPTPLQGNLGYEMGQVYQTAFHAALQGECAVQPDPEGCAREKAMWAVEEATQTAKAGEPMKHTIEVDDIGMSGSRIERGKNPMTHYDPHIIAVRRLEREIEAKHDAEMLAAGKGESPAMRPAQVSSGVWRSLPASLRTVKAMLNVRAYERAYQEAADLAIEEGWERFSNPGVPEEYLFRRFVDTPDGAILVRSVLVRPVGGGDWYMKELSRGAAATLAARAAPGEVRYRPFVFGSTLDDISILRGGPGSGHHGHKGVPGHLGGSAPGEGGPSPSGSKRWNPLTMTDKDYDKWIRDLSKNSLSKLRRFQDVVHGQLQLLDEAEKKGRTVREGTHLEQAVWQDALMSAIMVKEWPKDFKADEFGIPSWLKEMQDEANAAVERGGPGSGHFSHKGRPGERGGSAPGLYVPERPTKANKAKKAGDLTPTDFHSGEGRMKFEDPSTYTWLCDSCRKTLAQITSMMPDMEDTDDPEAPVNLMYDRQMFCGGMECTKDETAEAIERGGPGSGHYGHAGRPGVIGGSTPSYAPGTAPSDKVMGEEEYYANLEKGRKPAEALAEGETVEGPDDWSPAEPAADFHEGAKTGKRGHLLLTKELEKQLPPLYSNEEKGKDAQALVKFFSPMSNWTWYASEYDPESRTFFGLVDGFEKEFGYFSLDEMEGVEGPAGMPSIERDIGWEPKTFNEILGEEGQTITKPENIIDVPEPVSELMLNAGETDNDRLRNWNNTVATVAEYGSTYPTEGRPPFEEVEGKVRDMALKGGFSEGDADVLARIAGQNYAKNFMPGELPREDFHSAEPADTPAPKKNGYIAFYKGKQIEVYADTKYAAQLEAAKLFKAKKSYDVTVELAEKDGEPVVHLPLF